VLDAVVDAALARRLAGLWLEDVRVPAAGVASLARLLGGSALRELTVWCGFAAPPLLDAPGAALLAGTLRANSTLTLLRLWFVELWGDIDAAATLLGALVAHPSLRTLNVADNRAADEADRAAAGAALAALLAANAPALTELDVRDCDLGDDGMRPLLAALAANTHLRSLTCGGNDITEALAADVLLPAVRANGSLRALDLGANETDSWPGERDAEMHVNGRLAARP
jgi:hypothetical protein